MDPEKEGKMGKERGGKKRRGRAEEGRFPTYYFTI